MIGLQDISRDDILDGTESNSEDCECNFNKL